MKLNKYLKLTILFLLALGWLYPFHYAPWPVAENEFFILIIPIFLSITLLKNKEIVVGEFVFLLLFMLYFSFFQYYFLDYYFLESLVIFGVYVFFIIIVLMCEDYFKDNVIFFLKILFFLCLLNSLFVLFQFFNVKNIFILEHLGNKRFYANIGQPNHLSTLFLMGLVCSLILYRRKFFGVNFFLIISIFFVFLVFLTGSRTGFFTLIVLMILSLWQILKNKIKFDLILFGFLIFIYMIFNFLFVSNSRGINKNIDAALSDSRWVLWSDSISSIQANPWIGYGINGIRTSRLYGNLNFGTAYSSSHNIFLDFCLWFGLIGGGGFCLYLIFLIFKLIKNNRYGYEIALFLTPFLVHSIFEYPFRYLYFLVLIIPVFTLGGNIRKYRVNKLVCFGVVFVYGFLVSISYIEFKEYSRGAFFAQSKKCEISSELSEPILMDLMYSYSKLYCNRLNKGEMKKVVYNYSYSIHIEYYVSQGFYDGNLDRVYRK